jgi:cytochrome c2
MSDPPRFRTAILACWLLGPVLASADSTVGGPSKPPTRPIVPGFERFHAGQDADRAVGGRLLIGELGCVSCHRAGDDRPAPVGARRAPILDRVGARVKVDHLRAFLADPRSLKPGTTMPDLLSGLPKEEALAVVDALVHFLATTGTVAGTSLNREAIGPGKTLYEQSGCVACHGPADGQGIPLATSVPLGDLGGKYDSVGLAGFLQDPLAVRPSGRMPATPATASAGSSRSATQLSPRPGRRWATRAACRPC